MVPDGQHIVCSDECRTDDISMTASRVAALELLLATTRSYKGLTLAFKPIAAVLFLSAVCLPWLPVPSHATDLDLTLWRAMNIGMATILASLGAICIICSRYVANVTQRHDELVQRLPDPTTHLTQTSSTSVTLLWKTAAKRSC
jgi:hypothetical protein